MPDAQSEHQTELAFFLIENLCLRDGVTHGFKTGKYFFFLPQSHKALIHAADLAADRYDLKAVGFQNLTQRACFRAQPQAERQAQAPASHPLSEFDDLHDP